MGEGIIQLGIRLYLPNTSMSAEGLWSARLNVDCEIYHLTFDVLQNAAILMRGKVTISYQYCMYVHIYVVS